MQHEQKTILEWFATIKDEEIRNKAISNYDYAVGYADSLAMAIQDGFYWGGTIEGFDYWDAQYHKSLNEIL